MYLRELRGKKANINRWEALKQLDIIKDKELIEFICNIKNPLFFSTRTIEEIIDSCKEEIEFNKKLNNILEGGCNND